MLRAVLIAAMVVSGTVSLALAATPEVREDFEGPETSWQDAGGDARYRVDAHARLREQAHSGQWCEHVRTTASAGTRIHFAHDLGQASVIGELALGVWVKSDRSGVQLLARIVLPRTIDPRTKSPATILVPGSGYTRVGHWQHLKLDSVPLLLEREARVLRTQIRTSVDVREAYVDRAVLNVYGGPGTTAVWIDELEVAGFAGRRATPVVPDQAFPRDDAEPPQDNPFPATSGTGAPTASVDASAIRAGGGVLRIGGQTFFPRIVAYRGEPLARLRALGFNAVRLAETPSPAFADEAAAAGVWLFAPPPGASELARPDAQARLGRLSSVLAWDLHGIVARDGEALRDWANRLKDIDPHARPLVGDASLDARAASRHVDILVATRRPLGSSLEMSSYLDWLGQRRQLGRPGTPIWTTVQTEPAAALAEQAQLLAGQAIATSVLDHAQVRQLAYVALALGSRGLAFESQTPLDAADLSTRRRATILELLNLELDLVEPWAAEGNFVTSADCPDASVMGAVVQTERTRLLVPIVVAPRSQLALGKAALEGATFVVPGVPESNDAYILTPTELRPLAHTRAAGGVRISLPPGQLAPVVFTQDPLVARELGRRIVRSRRRAADLAREIAAADLDSTAAVVERLPLAGPSLAGAKKLLAESRGSLAQIQTAFAREDLAAAYVAATRATRQARDAQRLCLDLAYPLDRVPGENPLAARFDSLVPHFVFAQRAAAQPSASRLLPGGDLEDLSTILRAGWRHFQFAQAGVATDVALAPDAAHSGRLGLNLRAAPADGDAPPLVDSPPLWVTSCGVNLAGGQAVCIRAWVNVPAEITGSVDGLLVADSIAGESLALRIGPTRGWRELVIYRAAPRAQEVTVTFALSGYGEARIDDVSIEPLGQIPLTAAAPTGR